MSIRACCLALLALFLIAVPRAVTASDLELIQPRADRSDYQILIGPEELNRDLRGITEMLFRTYVVDLTALAERIGRQADAAGRREVEEALAGRRRIDPAELRQMRADVRRVELDVWEPAQRLLEDLVVNTKLILSADEEAFEARLRQFRRSVFLAPLQAFAVDAAYAGEGLDLLELLDEAFQASELGAFDPQGIADDLAAYEKSLDQHLQREAAAWYRSRLLLAVARVERDDEAIRAEEGELVALWRNAWTLQQQYASRIGQHIEARAGAAARLRWDDRVEQSSFPWLYAASRPERQYRWIAQNRIVDADVKRQADAIILAHRQDYRELAREAIDLILRSRLEMGLLLSARTDPSTLRDRQAQGVLRDLLQNSGRRSHRDDQTSQALEALLPDRLRAQMRSDLAAAAFGRRR